MVVMVELVEVTIVVLILILDVKKTHIHVVPVVDQEQVVGQVAEYSLNPIKSH